MKRELFQQVEIPEGVEVEIEGHTIKVKGPEGEIEKKFGIRNLEFKKEENKIIVGNKKSTKNEKKVMNSIAAHIKNMVKGVNEKFEYKLKVCFSHFPMTVEIKEGVATIKNFLGEKTPRKTKIPSGVDIDVAGEIITIKSPDRELAGQVAANFESVTKVRNRDRRVFQDGIFMTNKPGREI